MRVAYVTFEARGGMMHYAESLGSAARRILEAHVVVVAPEAGVAPFRERRGYLTQALSASVTRHRLLEKYNPLHYRRIARNICQQTRAEVVHVTCHSVGLAALVEELRHRGVVTVYTLHDPLSHEEATTLWGRAFRRYERRTQLPRIARALSAIHVHSPSHVPGIAALCPAVSADRIYAVNHGAGLTAAVAGGSIVPAELQALDPRLPTILFFGRIEPYKGLPLLAEALSRRNDGLRVNVLIAGAGAIDADLSRAADQRVVIINRFIDDAEIAAIFRASDLVVLPYLAATQSGIVPLAYAFGRPVVATQVGALPDVVVPDSTGALVEPDDPAALRAALTRLLGDRQRLAALQRGASRFLAEHLSWDIVAAQHVEHYRRLVARQRVAALTG